MELIDLSPDHRAQFARFSCNDGTPWAAVADEIVHDEVADSLALHNYAEGVGWFDDGTLRGLAVWRLRPAYPAIWHLAVLAVSVAAQGHGLGQRLMSTTVERAKQIGVRTLTADVDARNERMMKIVKVFRGKVRRDPHPEEFYNRICAIPVR